MAQKKLGIKKRDKYSDNRNFKDKKLNNFMPNFFLKLRQNGWIPKKRKNFLKTDLTKNRNPR